MIKVLHVLGHVPIGGIGSYLKNIANNIDKRAFSLSFVMFSSEFESDFVEVIADEGFEIEILGSRLSFKSFNSMRKDFKNYIMENHDFDIIHLHSPVLGIFVFPIAREYKIKARVLHSHAVTHSDTFLKSFRNKIVNYPSLYYSNNYVSCTKDAGLFLFRKRKFTILKNGIDLSKYRYNASTRRSMREIYNLEDKIIVGNIGNFFPVKNHRFLIEVFEKLLHFDNSYHLFMIGSGKYKQEIEAIIHKKNISSSVSIIDRVDNVEDYLQMFDVCLLPSISEGFGLVALEAQASGLTCICSDAFPEEIQINSNCIRVNLCLDSEKWASIVHSQEFSSNGEISNSIVEYDSLRTVVVLQKYYTQIIADDKP